MCANSYNCVCRALDNEGDRVRFTPRWLFAYRGELRLTDRAIECGNWVIPYKDILDAVIYEAPRYSPVAAILVICSVNGTYQFQLKSSSPWYYVLDTFWRSQTLFQVRFEAINLHEYLSDKSSLRSLVFVCMLSSFLICLVLLWLRSFLPH
jgi:hypothetical protein